MNINDVQAIGSEIMNQSKILLAIIERAKVGEIVEPEEALTLLSSVIDRLDKTSDSYLQDVDELFSIGACIWQMRSE